MLRPLSKVKKVLLSVTDQQNIGKKEKEDIKSFELETI